MCNSDIFTMGVPDVGDFSFVRDADDRECIRDAYETAVRLGAMPVLASETFENFCWSSHDVVNSIRDALSYTGHSGASFGIVMRSVEAIAKGGWEKWALETGLSASHNIRSSRRAERHSCSPGDDRRRGAGGAQQQRRRRREDDGSRFGQQPR